MAAKKTSRILFLDTEFTSLGEPWPVELISVGLADSQGRAVFYAEADDFDPSLMSPFTRERVAPLLERGDMALPHGELCEEFFGAIADLGEDCALAANSTWDWLWVQMMAQRQRRAVGPLVLDDPSGLELWPQNLAPALALLNFSSLSSIDKKASWAASNAHFKTRFPHHALVDAVGMALCAKAAVEANPGLSAERPADLRKVFKLGAAAFEWQAPGPKAATGARI